MSTAREYRTPLLIAAGTLVVALLLWVILIAPQNSKLSHLKGQQSSLQTQESTLQVKLTALKTEQQKLTSSCADLQKIATQIPSVQTPTDVDAEESSFESQFNGLVAAAGVNLTQFSGFTPASSVPGSSSSASTSAAGTSGSTTGSSAVVAVPTTLSVSGTYSQVLSFVNGLDGFPRLFVIQTFQLSIFSATGSGSGSGSSGSSSGAAPSSVAAPQPSDPPFWTGGSPPVAGTSKYLLSIDGSIYYTTHPSALDACTKATEAAKQG